MTLLAYETVNLFAQYEPTSVDGLVLRADVYNLFDANYTSRRSDGIDFAGGVPLTVTGRTISLTASVEF